MASTYTDLGLELMATGENAGTWGTKTNANLNLAEQLLGGFKIQTLNAAGSGANTTALTIADGALTGSAQNRVIILGAVSPQAITDPKESVPYLRYLLQDSNKLFTGKFIWTNYILPTSPNLTGVQWANAKASKKFKKIN